MPSTQARPVPALDGIRGIAILAVLLHQLIIDERLHTHALQVLNSVAQAGWVGVQLFFVLSGFLITGILLDTRGAANRWRSFYARRALRIFPLYYLLLAVTAAVMHGAPPWRYWLYVSNWAVLTGGEPVTALGHCWSLAVEEQFYLVWPAIVFALRPRVLAGLCGGIFVAALLLRIGLRLEQAPPELLYEHTVTRMDALALGALAAIAVREPSWHARLLASLGRLSALAAAALVATALASGVLARTNAVAQTVGHSVIALASALLVLLALGEKGRVARVLATPILRRFGRHSYAIYVLHLPLHLWVTRSFLHPHLAAAGDRRIVLWQLGYYLAGTAALLGLATLVYVAFEKPFLSLKRHFAAA